MWQGPSSTANEYTSYLYYIYMCVYCIYPYTWQYVYIYIHLCTYIAGIQVAKTANWERKCYQTHRNDNQKVPIWSLMHLFPFYNHNGLPQLLQVDYSISIPTVTPTFFWDALEALHPGAPPKPSVIGIPNTKLENQPSTPS